MSAISSARLPHAADRARVVQHLVHRHRQRAVVAQQHVGQRVADEHGVDTAGLGADARADGVVGGEHDERRPDLLAASERWGRSSGTRVGHAAASFFSPPLAPGHDCRSAEVEGISKPIEKLLFQDSWNAALRSGGRPQGSVVLHAMLHLADLLDKLVEVLLVVRRSRSTSCRSPAAASGCSERRSNCKPC